MADEAKPKYLHNPFAPEIFSNGAFGFRLAEGCVSAALASTRANHTDGSTEVVLVGTLTLPVSGAQALAVSLYDFLARHGVAPNMPKKEEMN